MYMYIICIHTHTHTERASHTTWTKIYIL